MLQDLFHQINVYLLTHPALLAKMKLLFWVKYWALLALFGFFLFLVYREQGLRRRNGSQKTGRQSHCFEA